MAAAAAALSRSRGAAGARTAGGLFFIFTLLSLLCLANSHLNKDELEQLKGKARESEKDLDLLKAKIEIASEKMNAYMSFMDPLSDFMEKVSSASSDGFPPLKEFVHELKDYMQKIKVYTDDHKEKVIKSKEDELRKMKKLIQIFEEHQAEL